MKTLTAAAAAIVLLSGVHGNGAASVATEDLTGGANWRCALALLAGAASIYTANVPGAIVSGAAINRFC
jgi:hypothetical protein